MKVANWTYPLFNFRQDAPPNKDTRCGRGPLAPLDWTGKTDYTLVVMFTARLLERPGPGAVFDRFLENWLTETSLDQVAAALEKERPPGEEEGAFTGGALALAGLGADVEGGGGTPGIVECICQRSADRPAA